MKERSLPSPTKRPRRRGHPDPAILGDVIERIVRAARPERIVMFGSAARGTMGPNSDLDLLVIKAGTFKWTRVYERIVTELRGKTAPVDFILVSRDDIERFGNSPALVIYPAIREGKTVYEA